MKKTFLAAATAAALSVPAVASAQEFVAVIDPADGSVTIEASVPFVGIEMNSASGALLPNNAPIYGSDGLGLPAGFPDDDDAAAFLAYSNIIPLGGDNFFAILNQPLLGASATVLAAGSTTGSVSLADQGGSADLGQIIDVSLFSSDAELLADFSGIVGRSSDLAEVPLTFVLIPEPATAGLVGVAGLGLLARRRRA